MAPGRRFAALNRMALFEPGRNCWRTASAARGAFLIDGEAYFRALHDALGRAREQVMILTWDVDSRLELLRGRDARRAPSSCLEDRLHEVLDDNAGLNAYLLDWDFSVIYAPEREWLPVFRLPWARHRRLRFELDDQLPYGASHHQKIVVVDDAIAFCGGIDPTRGRWDSSRHEPGDRRRRMPDGSLYPPFHDLQLLVAGDAAAALGELARARWCRATGERLAAPAGSAWEERWPAGVPADFDDRPVAIARTAAEYGEFGAVREVEQLHREMIAAARSYLYIESQYLSSGAIVRALCESLAAPHGPEILVLVPLRASGWLEESTLGQARDQAARGLRAADVHGRLQILCPVTGEGEQGIVNLHSKLVIMDDRWIRVGSANLSNRSMSLDTECDLVVDEGRASEGGAARRLLARLIGEHTGAGTEAAQRAFSRGGGLLAAVRSLDGGGRRLEPLPEGASSPATDAALDVADPERPLEPQALSRLLGGADVPPQRRRRRILQVLLVLAVIAGLGLAWRFTPLDRWLSAGNLARWRAAFVAQPWAPVAAVAAFPLSTVLVLPVTGMIALTALVFGPVKGFLYSFVGVALAASANFVVGAMFGRSFVRRVAGPRVNGVSRRIGRQGVLAMAALRLVPVAPFTVVNLVAGASHISFHDFLLGSLLGMGPGMAALCWFTGKAGRLVTGPELGELGVFLAGLGLLLFAVVLFRNWLRSRSRR